MFGSRAGFYNEKTTWKPAESHSRYGLTSQNCDVLWPSALTENCTDSRSPYGKSRPITCLVEIASEHHRYLRSSVLR